MDDDILTNAKKMNKMFETFNYHNLLVAQSVLSRDSYYSDIITLKDDICILRFTNFVEAMCPLFKKEILLYLLSTFYESESGWGLDLLWPHLLNYPKDKIGIIDEYPVKHTRQVGMGDLYNSMDSSHPTREMHHIVQKYSIKWPYQCIAHVAIMKVL